MTSTRFNPDIELFLQQTLTRSEYRAVKAEVIQDEAIHAQSPKASGGRKSPTRRDLSLSATRGSIRPNANGPITPLVLASGPSL